MFHFVVLWVTSRANASYSVQCELGVGLDRLRTGFKGLRAFGFVVDVPWVRLHFCFCELSVRSNFEYRRILVVLKVRWPTELGRFFPLRNKSSN
jgi:hypothetical protein